MMKHIDYVFFGFGAKIWRNTRLIEITNTVLNYIFLFDWLLRIFLTIYNKIGKGGGQTFIMFNNVLYLTFTFLSQRLIRNRRDKIIDLATNLEKGVTPQIQQRMNKYERALMVMHVVTILLPVVSILLPLFEGTKIGEARARRTFVWIKDIKWHHRAIDVFRMVFKRIMCDQFINLSLLPYVYLAICIELTKQALLQRASHATNCTAEKLYNLILSLQHYHQLKLQFENIFGVFSFMWLAFLFCSATGYLAVDRTKTDHQSLSYLLLQATRILQIAICFVCLYIVNQHIAKSESMGELLRVYFGHVVSDKEQHLVERVYRELERKVIYKAAGFFELRNSLIVNFANALIAFTVMFLQFK